MCLESSIDGNNNLSRLIIFKKYHTDNSGEDSTKKWIAQTIAFI
jgi:hypothetical protein